MRQTVGFGLSRCAWPHRNEQRLNL